MSAPKILHLCSALILALGLVASALIYATADDEDERITGASQVVIVDGKSYAIPLNRTKTYRREIERFGGKAAIVFDELSEWFDALWHGKALAGSVLAITIFLAAALWALSRFVTQGPAVED